MSTSSGITSWRPRTTDRSRGQGGAPDGRTTLTPARTVVALDGWWRPVHQQGSMGPVIYSGVIPMMGVRPGRLNQKTAVVPEEAMTCGERARPRMERLVLIVLTG